MTKAIYKNNIISVILLSLIFTFSCQSIKTRVGDDLISNRYDLYRKSYGEIDDPEFDPE